MKRRVCLFLMLCCLSAACSGAVTPVHQPIERTGFFFDTFIMVRLYDTADESLLDGCMELAEHYERLFSATKEGSDIWNINHAAGAPVTVDGDTIRLLEYALAYSARTGGVFDVTIGAVSSLWNFSREPLGPVPDEALIAEALSHVGYEGVVIDQNTVRLSDPDARLDMGAIAKGYIADRFKDYLTERGVTSATINLGGNVLAIGKKPDGSAFRVGVQRPFDTQGGIAAIVDVDNASVVSSGNYERCFEADGRLYHHILDPKTGYPADSDLLGATILAGHSVDADALSTACFIMGADEAARFIEREDGVEALFILGVPGDTGHYEIRYTSGFPRE